MEIIKIIDEKINFKCKEFHFINPTHDSNSGLISFNNNFIYIDDYMFTIDIKMDLVLNNSDNILKMLRYFKMFICHELGYTFELNELLGYKMKFKYYKDVEILF